MKGRFTLLVALILAVCLAAASPAAAALNLRLNIMYSERHPLSMEAFKPWADEVAKVTQGRVKVTVFYSNALSVPQQVYDATVAGAIDVGLAAPTYARDRFLLSGVLDLPMVASTYGETNSVVMWELFEQFPEIQNEYKDVKMLWMYVNPAYQLHFTKKEVRTLEDLKGAVISGGGTMALAMLRALGAAPEAITMTDVYLALQKGVVEGCFLPYAPLRSQRIADVLNFHTEANLVANTFYVVMNKSKWNSISPRDQQAIEAISGMAMARQCGKTFDIHEQRDIWWMKEKGDTFYTLTPEERQRWAERILPLRADWVKDTEAKGLAGQRILDEALRLLEIRHNELLRSLEEKGK